MNWISVQTFYCNFNHLKNIVAISLLALFLYQTAGIFIFFRMEQQAIRKEIKKQIKEGVPESELHTLNIDATNYKELIWHNHKEFMYQGTMYDIVHRKITGTYSVIFQCVNDSQETELFASLHQQVDKTMDSKHHGKHPLKIVMLSFIEIPSRIVIVRPDESQAYFSHYQTIFSDKHLNPILNPPDYFI